MNDGECLVGVVGDASTEFDAAIADPDAGSCRGDAESVLASDPDLVVAVGDASFFDVAHASPVPPVLPVGVSHEFASVPASSLGAAVATALGEDVETRRHPVLRVDHDGESVARAVADVTLVTAEVAHISEYAVAVDERQVAQFRADGVVVATPAGSAGYARRVGCPVVAPETGVGAVAPIAPFATDPDHWVLPLEDLRLTVERDETDVALLADDREVATVGTGEPVRITPAGAVDVAVVPESGGRF